jgi:hypothetical protein
VDAVRKFELSGALFAISTRYHHDIPSRGWSSLLMMYYYSLTANYCEMLLIDGDSTRGTLVAALLQERHQA